MDALADLLALQDGVIARRQVLACGLPPAYVARRLRRRDWVPVHPGVYVNHTGPLTWRQRAWAAVLACGRSALDGWSAIRAHEGPGRRAGGSGPIEVVVPRGHRPARIDGVRVRESRGFEESAQLHLSPPRVRYDDAIILLSDRAADDLQRVAILADACGGRRTTSARLVARIDESARLRHRALMVEVLRDIAEGTCSVLEHAYLTRVERAHGLPRGLRQVAVTDDSGRRMYRDVVYGGRSPRWRQIIELDGRLGHDTAIDRDRDLERDLDAALADAATVRLGYGQVLGRPCATAVKVALLLQRQGWIGELTTCPSCRIGDRHRSDQAG